MTDEEWEQHYHAYDSISSRELIVSLTDVYEKVKDKRESKSLTIEETATLMQKHLNEIQSTGVAIHDLQYLLNDDGKQIAEKLYEILINSLNPDGIVSNLETITNTLKDVMKNLKAEKTNKYTITVNQDYTRTENRPVYEISIKNEGHIDFGPDDTLDKHFMFETEPKKDAGTFTHSIIVDSDKVLESKLLTAYKSPVTLKGECEAIWFREYDGLIYKGLNPPKRFFLSFGRFKCTIMSGTIEDIVYDDSTNIITNQYRNFEIE